MMMRYGRRCFSSLSSESPRVAIAKNMLKYEAIAKATSEAELAAASKLSPSIDTAALPSSIGHLKGFLSQTSSSSSTFVKDPSAWQNLSFGAFAVKEAGRKETYPFIIGAVVTYLLLGVMLPMALPKEGKKDSKYISYIEGRHGKIGDHHDSHDSHKHDSHAHH